MQLELKEMQVAAGLLPSAAVAAGLVRNNVHPAVFACATCGSSRLFRSAGHDSATVIRTASFPDVLVGLRN